MPLDPRAEILRSEMTAWRRDFHAHPETAYEERRTAERVAGLLGEFGYALHRGLAQTGVVGTLKGQRGEGPALALRADMDALSIQEAASALPYRSRQEGKMHACGHDGHMAMLLGAAKILAQEPDFAGTLHLIFQPAEENEAGARRMVEEGLFDLFPCDAVFGLHNWPALPAGVFALSQGPVMASCDIFEIEIEGKGAHAAMPHLGRDPLIAAAQIALALQNIVARETDPLDAAVISVTQIHGGDTWNVIPGKAVLRGTARALKSATQDHLERRLRETAQGIAQAAGVEASVRYERRYPPTVNAALETQMALDAVRQVVLPEQIITDPAPSMGSEDFAFLLQKKPGCYVWMGTGAGSATPMLHNPGYDFNDAALVYGASYWLALTRRVLGTGRPSPGAP